MRCRLGRARERLLHPMAREDTGGERRDLLVPGGLEHPERLWLSVASRQSDLPIAEASSMFLELDKQSAACFATAVGLIEEDPPDLSGLGVEPLQAAAAESRAHRGMRRARCRQVAQGPTARRTASWPAPTRGSARRCRRRTRPVVRATRRCRRARRSPALRYRFRRAAVRPLRSHATSAAGRRRDRGPPAEGWPQHSDLSCGSQHVSSTVGLQQPVTLGTVGNPTFAPSGSEPVARGSTSACAIASRLGRRFGSSTPIAIRWVTGS